MTTIGIDIREAREGGAGKGRYTLELTRAMIAEASSSTFILFGSQPNPPLPLEKNVRYERIPGRGIGWQLALAYRLWRQPVDWMLSPTSYIYAALSPRWQKTVIVVHDMIAFLHASDHPWFPTFVERFTLKRAVRRTRVVCCISEHTRTDMLDRFPEAADKITIVQPAIAVDFQRSQLHTLELPTEFILFVGTLLPRKNLRLLLKVMEHITKDHPTLHLCIAGQDRGTAPLVSTLPMDIRSKVHILGRVSDEQLRELYSRAKVFAFPSMYEGFGIPPLEAMACGCPVVASDRSSIPEAVGEGGMLVDPTDPQAWVRAIQQLFIPEVAEEWRQRGYTWVRRFSWEKSAQTLLSAMGMEPTPKIDK